LDDVRLCLSDGAWERLGPAIQQAKRSRAGAPPKVEERLFLEALLHLARTGEPWRDLPACFGAWDAVYNRFRRWLAAGVWQRLFQQLAGDDVLEPIHRVFIDSTIIRAHSHAAGAPAKKGGKQPRDWVAVAAGSAASCTSPAPTRKRRWQPS
jgi:putative transposase